MNTDSSQKGTHERRPDPGEVAPQRQLGGETVWILISLATSGLVVGWLTGLSESPVAGVVLPLILALIAGAGGFHFASKRQETISARDSLRRTAQATAVFMLCCALGLHLGIVARTTTDKSAEDPDYCDGDRHEDIDDGTDYRACSPGASAHTSWSRQHRRQGLRYKLCGRGRGSRPSWPLVTTNAARSRPTRDGDPRCLG